jgi:hypothetical protein
MVVYCAVVRRGVVLCRVGRERRVIATTYAGLRQTTNARKEERMKNEDSTTTTTSSTQVCIVAI